MNAVNIPGYFFIVIMALACSEPVYQPKPRMFPSINFPETHAQKFQPESCPYTFQHAGYFQIQMDTNFFDENVSGKCWLNMQIPVFNGTLHCSYYPLTSQQDLTKYIKDAYQLAREHQKKANFIDELPIHKPGRLSGMLFNIEGPVASPFQFFLTDSSHHFFRASLYFNSQAKPDSLAPIVEYVKKDIMEMINSFEWR